MKLVHIANLGLLAALFLSGCDKAEPTSYQIPKEDRSVVIPSTPSNAKVDASTSGSSQMNILPGMADAADQAGGVSYSVPSGWKETAPSGIRKANLQVSDPNGSAELTVLVFPGDVGGRLANINRWREQVGLEPVTPEGLPEFTEGMPISKHRGLYVRVIGSTDSILGGLLPFHGSTWFFKLQGNTDTVLANEAKMRAFLQSVELEDTHH